MRDEEPSLGSSFLLQRLQDSQEPGAGSLERVLGFGRQTQDSY